MIGTIIICCLLFSLNAAAQEQATTDSISTQKSKSKLALRLHQAQKYLDDKATGNGTRKRTPGPTGRPTSPFPKT
ncbi:MAG: hypothetical protein IJ902_02845 [Prevotella sp.]|nr:hypothetical protein [Prevotella sp.]